jgi:hypothetical protein
MFRSNALGMEGRQHSDTVRRYFTVLDERSRPGASLGLASGLPRLRYSTHFLLRTTLIDPRRITGSPETLCFITTDFDQGPSAPPFPLSIKAIPLGPGISHWQHPISRPSHPSLAVRAFGGILRDRDYRALASPSYFHLLLGVLLIFIFLIIR